MPDSTNSAYEPSLSSRWADAESVPTRLVVLGMAHADGSIHAAEVYPVAEVCGVSADSVRSVLRRLVTEGLFDRTGDGRDAVYHPTEAGMLTGEAWKERTRLAYVRDATGSGWDRRWRFVAFAVPESQRTARDRLRDHLMLFGGASLHPGLYVSPNDWLGGVRAEAETLGISELVTTATTDDLVHGGTADPRQIAATLWPLEDLAARYQRFIDQYADLPDSLSSMRSRKERLSEADFLAGSLSVTLAFRSCFDRDPVLPPELLPRPWPGKTARDLVSECYRLATLTRESHDTPALFRYYAEIVTSPS